MVHPITLPPLDVPALLKRYNIRPDRRLGQNFLVDESALKRVNEAAGISTGDQILEIGAGLGSLTRWLALLADKVVAVELDRRLLLPLREVLSSFANVQVVHGDILEIDPAGLFNGRTGEEPKENHSGYIVVANIPYYITSAVIRHLLESSPSPRRMVLTVQKEVAERIKASPGNMNLLALSVQVYGKPSIAAQIPASAFYPPPKVDSAVVRIEVHPVPRVPAALLERFFQLAKAGFSQKRKTLRNALSAGMHLSPQWIAELLMRSSIDPQRRAETLSIDEWRTLAQNLIKES